MNKQKLHKQWADNIKKIGHCEVCNSTNYLNAHHVLDKELYPHLRYSLNNGICLCAKCHSRYGKTGVHNKTPWHFFFWLQTNKVQQYNYIKNTLMPLPAEIDTDKINPITGKGYCDNCDN